MEMTKIKKPMQDLALMNADTFEPRKDLLLTADQILEIRRKKRATKMAKMLLKIRRLRESCLPGIEFGEPGWDILLDLYVARGEQRKVSASSLCIGAAVPATTALRWMAIMVGSQHLKRTPDPRDGRRVFIELTETAASDMDAFMEHLVKTFCQP